MRDMERNEFEEQRIDAEAASWVSKRIKGLTAEEQDAFFEWMAADPRHSAWYKRHMKSWKQLDLLAQWKPEHSEKPNPYLLKQKMRWHSLPLWLGMAATLILGFWLLLNSTMLQNRGDDPTIKNLVAETYQEHLLSDGSVVGMREGAALKVDFSKNERKVELVSSEAHFDVKADPENPFIVRARGVEYRAIGTAFSVSIRENQVELLVTEGTVVMARVEDPIALQSSETSFEVEVTAGQRTVAFAEPQNEGYKLYEVNDNEIDQLLKWKPKSLSFDQVSLQEVVDEFNARNRVQIVILNSDLKQVRVVASFHSANVDKLLTLLETTMDIQASYAEEDRILLDYETP